MDAKNIYANQDNEQGGPIEQPAAPDPAVADPGASVPPPTAAAVVSQAEDTVASPTAAASLRISAISSNISSPADEPG